MYTVEIYAREQSEVDACGSRALFDFANSSMFLVPVEPTVKVSTPNRI
jgi:hypothetical protein